MLKRQLSHQRAPLLGDVILVRSRPLLAQRAGFAVGVAAAAALLVFLVSTARPDTVARAAGDAATAPATGAGAARRLLVTAPIAPTWPVAQNLSQPCRGQDHAASSIRPESEAVQAALASVRSFVLFLGIQVSLRGWGREGGGRRRVPHTAQHNTTSQTFTPQRTGHSLVGSLLDAHPRAVVANEFDVLGWVRDKTQDAAQTNDALRVELFDRLLGNSMACAGENRVQGGYAYHVPGQWQGRWDGSVLILGDKKGGTSTRMFLSAFDASWSLLVRLQEIVRVPLRIVHVVRNPFDTITTAFLHISWRNIACEHLTGDSEAFRTCRRSTRYNSTAEIGAVHLSAEQERYLEHEVQLKMNLNKVNYRLKQRVLNAGDLQATWLDLKVEDLVRSPKVGWEVSVRACERACVRTYEANDSPCTYSLTHLLNRIHLVQSATSSGWTARPTSSARALPLSGPARASRGARSCGHSELSMQCTVKRRTLTGLLVTVFSKKLRV